MKKEKEEIKSNNLIKLEKNLADLGKSKEYLENEISRIRKREEVLREKIRREKKATSLMKKVEKLRHLPKRKVR
ncbi:MAG: hypothetical protein ABIH49_02575 [archaeon]